MPYMDNLEPNLSEQKRIPSLKTWSLRKLGLKRKCHTQTMTSEHNNSFHCFKMQPFYLIVFMQDILAYNQNALKLLSAALRRQHISK